MIVVLAFPFSNFYSKERARFQRGIYYTELAGGSVPCC
jgi:hypothetical protein